MSAELEAARRAREAQAAVQAAAGEPRSIPPPAILDPLKYCVWTTVALLAWVVTPAAVVAFFGTQGVLAYRRAWKAGLRRSDCLLRDPRLVMAYLGILAVAGAGWTVWRLAGWLGVYPL
jgi:hypothetical protein